MGNPIRVISPDGASGTIDEAELESALAQGFRAETADDVTQRERAAKYGDRGGTAFVVGGLRSGSLGVSDYVASNWSRAAREDIKGLQEFNPGESFAGEVVGGIGAAFIPGSPVAMVGRAGRAVEGAAAAALGKGVLGRAGAKALGGAAEGVITGTAQEVTRAAIEDAPVDAEKLLMGVGINALMGGAFAGGTSLAGSGLSKAATAIEREIAPNGIKGAIEDFADHNAMSAAGFIQSQRNKITPEQQAAIAKELRGLMSDGKIKAGANVKDILDVVGPERAAEGARIGEVLDSIDAASGGTGPQLRAAAKKQAAVAEAEAAAQRDSVRAALDEELQRASDRAASGLKPKGENAEEMARILALTNGKKGDALAAAVRKQRAALDELADGAVVVPDTTPVGGFDLRTAVQTVRQNVLPELDDPIFAPQMRSLEKLLTRYEAKAAQGVSFREANRFKSNIDKTISKFKDTPVSQEWKKKLRGVLDDEIEAQIRQVGGDDALVRFTTAKQRYGRLSEISKSANKAVDAMLGNRQVSLTDYIAGVGGAAAGLAAGSIIPVIGGPAVAIANKIARARGASAVAIKLNDALRNGNVDAVLQAINGATKKLASGAVDDAAQSVVSRAAEAIARGPQKRNSDEIKPQDTHKDKREWLAAQSDQLAKFATNPEAVTASISNILGATATQRPELAQALAVTASRALGHLQAVIPKPPPSDSIPALGTKWRPTDAEISRFERHHRAVTDPLSIFEDLRRGSITSEAIEALQAVYPQMTEKLRTSVLERLASKTDPLPYAAQTAVKSFLGSTQGAANVAQYQTVYSEQDGAQPQRPTQGQTPLSAASDSMTAAQRLAGRRR